MNAILSFAAAAATLVAAPAAAQHATVETHSASVSRAGLDLSRKGDVRTLDRRLGRAAAEVCGTASQFDLVGQRKVRHCRADTVARLADDRAQLIAAARRTPTTELSSR